MSAAQFSAGAGRESLRSARLPLRVRSAADLEVLMKMSRVAHSLPRSGLVVNLPGLDPLQSRQLEQRIRSFARACGCAEGATAALIALLAIEGLLAWQMCTRGPRWSDAAWIVIGVLAAALAGGLGKLSGMAVARFRFRHCCRRVIRSLDGRPEGLPRAGTP